MESVLVPSVGYVIDSVPFAAPSEDKEYYYMNGLAVEDYTDAAAFIVKQLENNSKVSIRVPSTTSEDEVKLVFRELSQEGVMLQKGYYCYGVIHVE